MTILWFGFTESKWDVVPLREFAKLGTGHTPSRDKEEYWVDCTIPWVTVEDIRNNGIDSLNPLNDTCQKISELGLRNSAAVLHPEGTVMLSRTASIGFSCVIASKMATTQAFVTWTPDKTKLNSKYLNAALMAMREHYFAMAYGATHLTIYFPDIKTLKIPLPPLKDQKLIVDFLDHETAKIDILIEKQQRLIALLKEKRQAVISHAVTKGLNPNVRMKDSGVEWLGDVPELWGVTKFHYEIDLLEGPGILANDFVEEGVPLLRIQNVKSEFVSNDYKTYLSPQKVSQRWGHFRVELGDLIISCSASTGLVSEVDPESVGAIPYTGLIRLRPRSKKISKDYIRLLVQSDLFFEQIANLQTGSTIQHFGPAHLQQMSITLPSISEQKEICEAIKVKLKSLNHLIELSEDQILIMQERRTALISAAVTGKIDVRNWRHRSRKQAEPRQPSQPKAPRPAGPRRQKRPSNRPIQYG